MREAKRKGEERRVRDPVKQLVRGGTVSLLLPSTAFQCKHCHPIYIELIGSLMSQERC